MGNKEGKNSITARNADRNVDEVNRLEAARNKRFATRVVVIVAAMLVLLGASMYAFTGGINQLKSIFGVTQVNQSTVMWNGLQKDLELSSASGNAEDIVTITMQRHIPVLCSLPFVSSEVCNSTYSYLAKFKLWGVTDLSDLKAGDITVSKNGVMTINMHTTPKIIAALQPCMRQSDGSCSLNGSHPMPGSQGLLSPKLPDAVDQMQGIAQQQMDKAASSASGKYAGSSNTSYGTASGSANAVQEVNGSPTPEAQNVRAWFAQDMLTLAHDFGLKNVKSVVVHWPDGQVSRS